MPATDSPTNPDAALIETAILTGGITREASFRGGKPNEDVMVRLLAPNSYPALARAMEDEVKQLAIYLGRPESFVESLTPASHAELISLATRLNADFFASWLDRNKARQEKLAPGLADKMIDRTVERISQELLASALANGSPKSPQSAI